MRREPLQLGHKFRTGSHSRSGGPKPANKLPDQLAIALSRCGFIDLSYPDRIAGAAIRSIAANGADSLAWLCLLAHDYSPSVFEMFDHVAQ